MSRPPTRRSVQRGPAEAWTLQDMKVTFYLTTRREQLIIWGLWCSLCGSDWFHVLSLLYGFSVLWPLTTRTAFVSRLQADNLDHVKVPDISTAVTFSCVQHTLYNDTHCFLDVVCHICFLREVPIDLVHLLYASRMRFIMMLYLLQISQVGNCSVLQASFIMLAKTSNVWMDSSDSCSVHSSCLFGRSRPNRPPWDSLKFGSTEEPLSPIIISSLSFPQLFRCWLAFGAPTLQPPSGISDV